MTPGEAFAHRIGKALLTELPVWKLLVLAIVTGALWAAGLFDWDFITGQDEFWKFPRGTIGGSQNDMATELSAYLYYIQDPWRPQLFYVSSLDAPIGVNATLSDFVPIVALIGKIIYSITGAQVNPYGGFLFLCFLLPGVMLTLVLIAAKIRFALAAIVGAMFANATPALMCRWGHIALTAQFLVIGAFALYLFSLQKHRWRGLATAWIVYLAFTSLINPYIFTMVGIVWVCSVIQRRLNGLASARQLLGTVTLTIASVSSVIAACQFGAGNHIPFNHDYGRASMNLLSPLVPQQSGVFSGLRRVIDATGGQYEGFNYLGLGLLLASVLVLPVQVRWLKRNLQRHAVLFVALLAVTAFAVSHVVFLGDRLLFELPMPYYLHRILGMYRASGRFFWLVCYAQMACVIVLGFRRERPLIAVCLLVAAIVQLLDVRPLREQIIASIAAGAGAEVFDTGQVARLITKARQVEVVPSYQCSYWYWNNKDLNPGIEDLKDVERANMELTLASARRNIPINSVYLARYSYGLTMAEVLRAPSRARDMFLMRQAEYCEQEIERARSGGFPGDVLVLLSDQPRPEEMVPGITCAPLSRARFCKRSDNPEPDRARQ